MLQRPDGWMAFARQLLQLPVYLFLFTTTVFAADPAALVANHSGDISVVRSGTVSPQLLNIKDELYAGDTLISGADGRATIVLSDESLVQINNNTRIVLKSVDQSAGWLPASASGALQSVYELLDGEIWFRNKNPATDLEIETPHVAIGVRGTEFVVRVSPDMGTEVDMLEGKVLASNPLGSIEATSGEQVYAAPGAAPIKRLLLNPDNAVQWTVLIPDLFAPDSLADKTLSPDTEKVSSPATLAWNKLQSGDIDAATVELASITSNEPDNLFAWQAYALALLASNSPAEGLEAIRQAQTLAPGAVESYLIESYLQQALFDFDAAMTAINKGFAVDADNLLVLVKAAQLQFGAGDLTRARQYAAQAAAVDALSPDVLNLLGFLDIAERNTEQARIHFETAIEKDPAFAEAHLGLGLTQIREGNETAALESISTAVALDPTRAMYMTYWGRVLYELGRHERALQVLQRAAELDPLDPTPWYLQAWVYRDTNRVGESIEAFNRAVALNDNRAVYRSRFLLDKDQAVRNVDMSVVFQDVEFDAWSDRKAVDAVNDDFGNYSAHIMYAGSLQAQENRNTAFLSETLQARLLQPANFNSFNNFNNYTTFVDQPGIGGTVVAQAGSYDAHTVEATVFGALPEQGLAASAQYFDTSSDGWDDDFNGDDSTIVSTSLKWDITLKDSLLLTFTDIDSTVYDNLFDRFEYDREPEPGQRIDNDFQRYEIGYRHNFQPGADLLAVVGYTDLDSNDQLSTIISDRSGPFTPPIPPGAPPGKTDFDRLDRNQDTDRSSTRALLQLNWLLDQHELIVGTSNYWGKNDAVRTERVTRVFQFFESTDPVQENVLDFFSVDIDNDTDRYFHNIYIHDTWDITDWFQLESAVYFDWLKNSDPLFNEEWRENKVNPRLGAVFRASEQDTIRIAAYRYYSPFFAAQLSPTEVAGVTVNRDTQEASLVRETNITWDRQWNTGFFTTTAFWTDNKVEAREGTGIPGPLNYAASEEISIDGESTGIGFEVNQLILDRVGFVTRYKFVNVDDGFRPEVDRDEHRAEFELNYVIPNGLFGAIRQGIRSYDFSDGGERETLNYTDLEAGYLFPNRAVELRIEGRNVFDNNFNWITDTFTLGGVIPERNWQATLELNF